MVRHISLICTILSLIALNASAQSTEPDPNFYIYLCYGQSNMEGYGRVESIDVEDIPDCLLNMSCVNDQYRGRQLYQWYKAIPPLVRETTGLSPADWFGRTMCDNLPDKRIGIVAVAVGGASLRHLDKEYDSSTVVNEVGWFQQYMAPYDNLPYNRLIACAKEAQKAGVIKGILLHQGEADNGNLDWINKLNKL